MSCTRTKTRQTRHSERQAPLLKTSRRTATQTSRCKLFGCSTCLVHVSNAWLLQDLSVEHPRLGRCRAPRGFYVVFGTAQAVSLQISHMRRGCASNFKNLTRQKTTNDDLITAATTCHNLSETKTTCELMRSFDMAASHKEESWSSSTPVRHVRHDGQPAQHSSRGCHVALQTFQHAHQPPN